MPMRLPMLPIRLLTLPTRLPTALPTTRCNCHASPSREALAIQEAAGTTGSLFFCPTSWSSPMRALTLVAGALALAACGNNDQTDNTQNIDENLTAENIVSNDVTAIDA